MEFVGREIEKDVYRITQLEDLDEKAAKQREEETEEVADMYLEQLRENDADSN